MHEQETLPLTIHIEQPLVPKDHWDIPPFNAEGVCAKCGYEKIHSRYHNGVATYEPCYDHFDSHRTTVAPIGGDTWVSASQFPEHLDRSCDRCSYQWVEATV